MSTPPTSPNRKQKKRTKKALTTSAEEITGTDRPLKRRQKGVKDKPKHNENDDLLLKELLEAERDLFGNNDPINNNEVASDKGKEEAANSNAPVPRNGDDEEDRMMDMSDDSANESDHDSAHENDDSSSSSDSRRNDRRSVDQRSDDLVDLNRFIAPIPHVRPWQLTDSDVKTVIFNFEAWKRRFIPYHRLPAVTLEPETDEQRRILYDRRKELRYLSMELYNIWSTGNLENNELECIASRIYQQNGGSKKLVPVTKGVDPMSIAFTMFYGTCNRVNMNPAYIDSKMDELYRYISDLATLHKLYQMNCVPEFRDSLDYVSRVVTAIKSAHHMLQYAVGLSIALDGSKSGMEPSRRVTYAVDNFFKIKEMINDMKPFQQYLIKLIERGIDRRYRRYRDNVYEELITQDGYRTNFWKKVCTIREFIKNNSTLQEVDMWVLATEGRNAENAVEHLTSMQDDEFASIKLDRHVFSFRNGIYFAANRVFRSYKDGDINWVEDSSFKRREDLGRPNYITQPSAMNMTNAAANYFNVDFIDYRKNPNYKEFQDEKGKPIPAFMKVETPVFSKILNDQEIPLEAQLVVFGLIGRLFYETGEMDNWQVVLWILGRAQTGKSTLCKLVELFYQSEDVAVISNNIEEKFGLESVYDKLIYMGPEIKRDFKLNQAEFQSMVGGEKMNIARKFKTAVHSLFNVPGMLAGNDMPGWLDSSHSIIRRIILLNFMNRLKKVDGDIGNKLAHEVSAIIFKCNEAYHYILEKFGNDQIWDHLPEYFKKTQQKLKSKTHPLYAFLESDEVDFDPSYSVTMDAFRSVFSQYVKNMNVKASVWNDELFAIPFQEKSLEISCPDEHICSDGIAVKKVQIIKGCKIRKDTVMNSKQPREPNNPSPTRQQDGAPRGTQQVIAVPKLM
jgi:ABC-type multidrug transport system fused ATPase/permease subunit